MGQPPRKNEGSDILKEAGKDEQGQSRSMRVRPWWRNRRQDGLNQTPPPMPGQPSDLLEIRCNHGGKRKVGNCEPTKISLNWLSLSCNDHN